MPWRLEVEAAREPPGATSAGANVHAIELLVATPEASVAERSQPTKEMPQPLRLGKGDDNPTGHETVATSRCFPPIRRIGEAKPDGNGLSSTPLVGAGGAVLGSMFQGASARCQPQRG